MLISAAGASGVTTSDETKNIEVWCIADIAPVVDGQVYYPGTRRLKYGGQDVTEYLRRLLLQQKDTSFREASINELQRLKEACIRVAESNEAAQSEVGLPTSWGVRIECQRLYRYARYRS